MSYKIRCLGAGTIIRATFLFVTDHSGLQTKKLGQTPIMSLLFLTPRPVLSSHQHRILVSYFDLTAIIFGIIKSLKWHTSACSAVKVYLRRPQLQVRVTVCKARFIFAANCPCSVQQKQFEFFNQTKTLKHEKYMKSTLGPAENSKCEISSQCRLFSHKT